MERARQYSQSVHRDEKGVVLVVGLLMISVLALIGTTAVVTSSTDMKISANYKSGNQAFYAAEAGIEEARARLKTDAPNPIADAHPTQTGWTAFIGAETKAQGKGYNSGNAMHTRVASLQSVIEYTVKIVHQMNAANQILYWGDVNGDGLYERNPTKGQNIYLVTSYGGSGNSNRKIEVEMTRVPPITAPAALYVNAPTNIIGNANVDGRDDCGTTGTSLPGIATSLGPSTVSISNNGTVNGTVPVASHPVMNVRSMIDSQKDSANYTYNVASATHTGMNWGTPSPGATLADASSCSTKNIVYYNTWNGANFTDIKLAGGSGGCGILLIDGDLDVSGGFTWYGIVVVSGSVKYTGGGDKNITGAVLAGGSVTADLVGGNTNIVYCSTAVRDQTEGKTLRRLSWMEKT